MFLSIHFLCCRRFYSKVQIDRQGYYLSIDPANFTSSGQISAWRVSATSSWSLLYRSRCYAPNEHCYCILWQCLWVWQLHLIKYVQASFNVKHQCIKASNQSPVIMCRKINCFRVTAPPQPNDWLCKNGTSMPAHPLDPSKDLITIAHLDSAIPAQCYQTLCAQKMQTC